MLNNFMGGEVAMELAKELLRFCKRACSLKSTAEQLKQSIEDLLPTIQDINHSGMDHLPQHLQTSLQHVNEKLGHGLGLVRKAASSSRFSVYSNIQLSREMDKVEKTVSRFLNSTLPAQLLAYVHNLKVGFSERLDRVERRVEGEKEACVLEEERERQFLEGFRCGGMIMSTSLRVGKEKVKEMILEDKEEVRVVGVCGMAGSGKTTLAKEISQDAQIRNHFHNRIIFETVSQSPNIEQLKQNIWKQINGNCSTNSHDLIPQWKLRFEQSVRKPTLVILDDVWSLCHLEQLIFTFPGCKTVVVSRFRFPSVLNRTYEVELLGEEEALALFCFSAFRQWSIPPNFDKKLVKQVIAECKGLPLALKVIGASLRGQHPSIWLSAKNRLSRGETISDTHEANLLERMAISIEFLSDKVRECFLDLGSLPEDKKIPLDVLVGMWVETHDLDEEDAFAILVQLSEKHLLSIVEDARSRVGDVYSSSSEISVTQHDVLRDLALHLSNRETLNRRKRLIMTRQEDGLPKDWLRNKDQPFDAQLVSIHTGEMKESDWFQMRFPKAEVLMLNFSSGMYFLPPFIETMPNLKSLVLINHGSASTILQNLSVFATLDNLRSLWLEKITIPQLCKTTVPLVNLRKISFVLCEVQKSLNGSVADLPQLFPRLSSLTLDHCIDLTKLPSSVCGVHSLESLSITNCHDLNELPLELGRLNSLRILRVCGCLSLKRLPQAICGLKKLQCLDLSRCVNLRSLPERMDQIISLEKIDMRECSQIRSIPMSATLLKSLGHVVCDEGIAFLWKEAEKVIPELCIQVAEEQFTLDWLVD